MIFSRLFSKQSGNEAEATSAPTTLPKHVFSTPAPELKPHARARKKGPVRPLLRRHFLHMYAIEEDEKKK